MIDTELEEQTEENEQFEQLEQLEQSEQSEQSDTAEEPEQARSGKQVARRPLHYYRIQFRPDEQIFTAGAKIARLLRGEVVIVITDHGQEPAVVRGLAPKFPKEANARQAGDYIIARRASRDEIVKFDRLAEMEQRAFRLCEKHIGKQNLPMNLVRVERFFNGSKIIFYFTAESRVDFRELVKALVQEFRTRVEMRQIGVRHETKMLGGLGCCGRELCCASFIKNFESVSIKMAKEQNLPLNPAKISGACNRLLCCLNYEFKTYKTIRKQMPKVGKLISLGGPPLKVRQHNVLQETIVVADGDNVERLLTKEEWQSAKIVESPKKK